MSVTIQADEQGALALPAGMAHPGARFSVEPHGSVVILRREAEDGERWWETTTPAQRVAWLNEWIRSLPGGPGLSPQATRRDSMYE